MTNQQRLEEIQQRLEILKVLNDKLNTIISILSDKRIIEPDIQFIKPNNVENTFIEDRQKELFQVLDDVKK